MKRTGFKSKNSRATPVKRPRLRVNGISDVSTLKREIQALVREFVIKRDGGCILRHVRGCGGLPGQAVLQADHLITRGNAATYADTRLIVCLCRPCHGGFKKWHEKQYEALVKPIIGKERTELWEKKEAERVAGMTTHMTKSDWLITRNVLRDEIKLLNE